MQIPAKLWAAMFALCSPPDDLRAGVPECSGSQGETLPFLAKTFNADVAVCAERVNVPCGPVAEEGRPERRTFIDIPVLL